MDPSAASTVRHAVDGLANLAGGWAAVSRGGRAALVNASNGILTLREFASGRRHDSWEVARDAHAGVNEALGELTRSEARLARMLDGMVQAVERVRLVVDSCEDADAGAKGIFATLSLSDVDRMAEEVLQMHRADFARKVAIVESILDETTTRSVFTQNVSLWMTQPSVVQHRMNFILLGWKADMLVRDMEASSPAKMAQTTPSRTSASPTGLKQETLNYLLS